MKYECKRCMGNAHAEYMRLFPEASHCMFCGRYVLKNDYHAKEDVKLRDRSNEPTKDVEESHPSYGQLSIHRQSGGYGALYGSAIDHQETICLSIQRSVKHSSPYHESYFSNMNPLVEVVMSAAQFAEAITTLNIGSGIPCTLKTVRGQYMPRCPESNLAKKANKDLADKMSQFASRFAGGMNKVNNILEKKGAINKGERNTIASVYHNMMTDLKSNLPFLHQCMTEAYEKTASATKADIEAFYMSAITKLGLDTLKKNKQIDVNDAGRLEYTEKDDADVVDAEFEEQK